MKLKQIKLPDNGSTYLSRGMFYNCPIEILELPESIIEVRDNCFYNNNFKTFVVPNRFKNSITFQSCRLLTSVIFEDGNDSNPLKFGRQFLNGCYGMTYIVLPRRTSQIANDFLGYANNIHDLYLKAETPPTLEGAFGGQVERVYIPIGSFEAYSSATNWNSIVSKFIEYDFEENPHGVI